MQKRLEPAFVKQQLMIEQFHPQCAEPNVRNVAFQPPKSLVP